jgi:uncharacterized membrane protein (DUF485 family)
MSERPSGTNADAWAHNARVGLVLFFIYCIFYGGFIYLSAFSRETSAAPSWGGVNVAIVYGFALIIGAFVLSIVYMLICRRELDEQPEMTEGEIAEKAAEEEGAA